MINYEGALTHVCTLVIFSSVESVVVLPALLFFYAWIKLFGLNFFSSSQIDYNVVFLGRNFFPHALKIASSAFSAFCRIKRLSLFFLFQRQNLHMNWTLGSFEVNPSFSFFFIVFRGPKSTVGTTSYILDWSNLSSLLEKLAFFLLEKRGKIDLVKMTQRWLDTLKVRNGQKNSKGLVVINKHQVDLWSLLSDYAVGADVCTNKVKLLHWITE